MQTSGMGCLCEIVNSLHPLTVFIESFILDLCTGSECVSGYFVLSTTTNCFRVFSSTYVQYTAIKTQSLIEFLNSIYFKVTCFLTLVLKNED